MKKKSFLAQYFKSLSFLTIRNSLQNTPEPLIKTCPLCCNTKDFSTLTGINEKPYYLCPACYLIHAEKKDLPTLSKEKERYLQHNNSIEEAGYIKFLYRAIKPTLPHLHSRMQGLDYGCGPVPVLAQLMQREGFNCRYYDPLFFPDLNMQQQFDFIFATECFEHFFTPAAELKKLAKLLKPGALLTIMTELWQEKEQFCNWYYVRDDTHVSFYHQNTLKYICKHFGLQELFNDDQRVFVLQKI